MAIDPDPSKLETRLDAARWSTRSSRPADASMDRAFFAGLSEQSRYMRFMQHLADLTPRLVQQFTNIDDTTRQSRRCEARDCHSRSPVGLNPGLRYRSGAL